MTGTMEQTTMHSAHGAGTFFQPDGIGGVRAKADELMGFLQGNDLEGALRCINQINRINNEHVHSVLGKITRGLHSAISDLSVSTANGESHKNRTRAGLDYVIEVTGTAARRTLDMTEQTQQQLQQLGNSHEQMTQLVDRLRHVPAQPALAAALQQLDTLLAACNASLQQISRSNTEIVVAQNFQDLASQSVTKAIRIITNVETSLIALTQHTNALKQLSLIATSPDLLETSVTEELKHSLERMEVPPVAESEHLDQLDVDNLLSSLGF